MQTTKKNTAFILLILLGLSGCAWWQPSREEAPESEAQEELRREKRQQLSEATQQLLAVSPKDNPETYASRQMAVENALTDYLAVTDSSEQDMVLLNHDGSIVILPLGQRDSVSSPGEYATPVNLWQTIGPSFQGTLLDMAWISSKIGPGKKLVALFPDSLTIMEVRKDKFQTIYKRTFPQETIPAQWPAGTLMKQSTDEDNRIELNAITTKLANAIILYINGNQIESDYISSPVKRTLTVKSWQTHSGQDLFRNSYLQSGVFRSLRIFPAQGKAVVLDSAGYLNLLDLYSLEYQWRSERSWGNRLYRAGNHSIAVLSSGQSSFVMFDIRENRLILVGESPQFNFPVNAVSTATINSTEGILVGLLRQQFPNESTQLHFLPRDNIQWRTPVDYPSPQLPDYNAELSVISSDVPGDSAHQAIPTNLVHNVYQTLFTIDNKRTVHPLLASGAQHISDWKTWEIYLRRDIRFSDGTDLTSRAVKSSWESRWKDCRFQACPSQWLWEQIEGAKDFLRGENQQIAGLEIVDENTFRIRLTEPLPYFIEHLTQPAFRVDKDAGENPYRIGTGPFEVPAAPDISGTADQTRTPSATPSSPWNLFSVLHATPTTSSERTPLKLPRNEEYQLGYAPLEEITVYPKSIDYSDSLVQKRNIITHVRNQRDIAYYRKLNQVTVRQFPMETIYFLAINPSKEALQSTRIRRKIATVLDKEVTVNVIDEAECSITSQFFSSKSPTLSAPELPDSLEPDQPLRITHLGRDLVAKQIAERLAARLSQQDILHTVPEAVSARNFHQHRTTGDYDILIDSYSPQFGTPSYNLAALLRQGYVVDAETMVSLNEHLSTSPEDYPEELELSLIEDGLLVPVFRAKSYAILPATLENIELKGAYKFDISRSWFPIE